jgi:hypothetical protein
LPGIAVSKTTAMMKRNEAKCYSFEEETAVGKLFNGVV